jgi:hypothetical protein
MRSLRRRSMYCLKRPRRREHRTATDPRSQSLVSGMTRFSHENDLSLSCFRESIGGMSSLGTLITRDRCQNPAREH